MEVGVWKSLTRRGITGKSMLDRRDFGKSASFLGCPAFLDDQTGTEFLVICCRFWSSFTPISA